MENISESILVIIYMLHSRSLRSTAKNKEKLKKEISNPIDLSSG